MTNSMQVVLTLEYWEGHGFTQPSYRIFATPIGSYDPSRPYNGKDDWWNYAILSAYTGTVELGTEKNLVGFLHRFEDMLHKKGLLKIKHHCHNVEYKNEFGDYLVEEPGEDKYRMGIDEIQLVRTGIVYDLSEFRDSETRKMHKNGLKNLFPEVAKELGFQLYNSFTM